MVHSNLETGLEVEICTEPKARTHLAVFLQTAPAAKTRPDGPYSTAVQTVTAERAPVSSLRGHPVSDPVSLTDHPKWQVGEDFHPPSYSDPLLRRAGPLAYDPPMLL